MSSPPNTGREAGERATYVYISDRCFRVALEWGGERSGWADVAEKSGRGKWGKAIFFFFFSEIESTLARYSCQTLVTGTGPTTLSSPLRPVTLRYPTPSHPNPCRTAIASYTIPVHDVFPYCHVMLVTVGTDDNTNIINSNSTQKKKKRNWPIRRREIELMAFHARALSKQRWICIG